MAKVNFDLVLKKLDGKPLKDDKEKDLTLSDAAKQSLLVNDEKQTGSEKYENYCLAAMVDKGGVIDLKSEDISKIKEMIGKYMFPVVVGPAWDALEGKLPAEISK